MREEPEVESPDLRRRAFLRGRSPKRISTAIRPPWSLPETEFTEHCTRCDQCINNCPSHILQRGDGGYPEVRFHHECTFCEQCVASCEAQAFQTAPYSVSKAWQLAVSIKPECLSLQGVVCRTCGDHCDSRAIRFQLRTRAVAIPLIDNQACTGCGACLAACPVNSISIKNHNAQELAA